MILEHIQDQTIHHAANVAAIVIPVMSAALNGPAVLTYTTAGLGCVWYAILIGERLASWVARWRSTRKD